MKPIFIVKVSDCFFGYEEVEEIGKSLRKDLGKDYYVLIINVNQKEEVKFEMYNAIDLEEKTFEELKLIVTTNIINHGKT